MNKNIILIVVLLVSCVVIYVLLKNQAGIGNDYNEILKYVSNKNFDPNNKKDANNIRYLYENKGLSSEQKQTLITEWKRKK